MAYNLASTLRPKKIADIYGQPHISAAILSNIKKGKLPKAYFFAGERGTGKTTSARLLAKAYNCENKENGDACDMCDMCEQMRTSFPVYLEELDCASHSTKESIPFITQTITPAANGTKFVILDEAHMFSPKTWIEIEKIITNIDSSKVCCVFCTTEILKIPPKVKSIGSVLIFNLMTETQIIDFLSEISQKHQLEATEEHINTAAQIAAGSIRDSLSALDIILSGGTLHTPPWDFFLEALAEKNSAKILEFFHTEITRKGNKPEIIALEATEILRGVFHHKIDETTDHPSVTSLSKKHSSKISIKLAAKAIEELGWAIQEIKTGTYHNDTLGLELPVVKICKEDNIVSPASEETKQKPKENTAPQKMPEPTGNKEKTLMEEIFSEHIPLTAEEKAEKEVMTKTVTDNVMAEIFG